MTLQGDALRTIFASVQLRIVRVATARSIVIVAAVMVLPSAVAAVIMPPAFVAVTPFIAVSIAIDRCRRVDHWRRCFIDHWRRSLIDDRGRCGIDGTRHTEKHADIRMCESRAGCARGAESRRQKKGNAFHGDLLYRRLLANTRQWRTTRILERRADAGASEVSVL
jgi:hypothetical protein